MIPIRDTIPSRRTPVVTWSLIGLNAVVFIWTVTLGERQLESLFYACGIVPRRYTDPAWALAVGLPSVGPLPFLASMFLHGGLLHLASNMWSLWIFGDNVEDKMGPWRFLAFYLMAGLAAGGLHLATNLGSQVPAIGASGAIAGVLGAYVLLFPRARVLTLIPIVIYPLFVHLPSVVFIGFWFVSQLLNGTISTIAGNVGGVAWWAHIGGFVAGLVLVRWFVQRPRMIATSVERRLPPTIDLSTGLSLPPDRRRGPWRW